MIIENVTQIWNPLLTQKMEKIIDFDSAETKNLIQDLIDTMRAKNLVGIAANQIGRNKLAFLTEVRKTVHRKNLQTDSLKIFINPKIIKYSEEKEIGYEGCGSVANAEFFGPVARAKSVTIEAYDEQWEKFTLEAEGFLARVIQHEMDHLEGHTFIEKIENMRDCMSGSEYRERGGKCVCEFEEKDTKKKVRRESFDIWNEKKKWFDEREVMINENGKKKSKIAFKEGEIWWMSLWKNLGSESYGKWEQFSRPVYIFRKFSGESFLWIPMTSKDKEGSWYFPYNLEGKNGRMILPQMRYMSTKRLLFKIHDVFDSEKREIDQAVKEFLKL